MLSVSRAGVPGMIRLRAPAKINLCLEVFSKRGDGYHDIGSVIAPVSLFDDVAIEPAGDITTSIEPAGDGIVERDMPSSPDNLCTRAALLFGETVGRDFGVRIAVRKRIPISAGLGGGSSDAAAVLIGLNIMSNARLGSAELERIGMKLGCDIPAFVRGGIVAVSGAGERLEKIDVAASVAGAGWWLVLTNPGFGVSTGDIYSRCQPSLTSSGEAVKRMVLALNGGDLETAAGNLFNGLEEVVFRKYPVTAMISEGLADAGALGVGLSGSGASVFGLARHRKHAEEIRAGLADVLGFPVWSEVVRIVPDGVMVAHGPLEA